MNRIIKKFFGFVLSLNLIGSILAVPTQRTIAAETAGYEITAKFDSETDLEKLHFDKSEMYTYTLEQNDLAEDTKVLKLKTTKADAYDNLSYTLSADGISDDIVKVSYRIKREDVKTTVVLYINDIGYIWTMNKQHTTIRNGFYVSETYGRINIGGREAYYPYVESFEQLDFEFDIKNKKLRIYEDGEEAVCCKDGKSVDITKFDNIKKIAIGIRSGGNGENDGVVYLDNFSVTSVINELNREISAIKEISEPDKQDVEKAFELYAKVRNFVDELGYPEDRFDTFIDKFAQVSSFVYKVDYKNKTISQIPWETEKDDFFKNVSITTSGEIYRGDQVIEGKIENGDILRTEGEEYMLNVIPASIDTSLKSEKYIISNDMCEIPYGTLFEDFVDSLIVHEFSKITYDTYPKNYSGSIDADFNVTVIAQSGDMKVYKISVKEDDDYDIEMESQKYNINNENKIIKVPYETKIDEFFENIIPRNGEKTELLDEKFLLKLSGNIEGGETLRVYKNGSKYGDYVDYTIFAENQYITDMNYQNENVEKMNEFHYAPSMTGLDGLNPIMATTEDSVLTFNYIPQCDGVVEIYCYITFWPGSKATTAENIFWKNGESETQMSFEHKDLPTGFNYLASFDVKDGDKTKLKFKGTNGLLKLTGVRFRLIPESNIKNVSEKMTSDGRSFVISTQDGVKMNLNNVRIFSKNGYSVKISVGEEDDKIVVNPQEKLKDDILYNLIFENGETKYVHKINPIEKKQPVIKAVIRYLDENGQKIEGTEGAYKCKISYESENVGENLKIFGAVYKNGLMRESFEQNIDACGEVIYEVLRPLSKWEYAEFYFFDSSDNVLKVVK